MDGSSQGNVYSVTEPVPILCLSLFLVAPTCLCSQLPLVGLLARSEKWRQRAGKTLEVGGALLVFLLGVATFGRVASNLIAGGTS
jgi:hypothetical protein